MGAAWGQATDIQLPHADLHLARNSLRLQANVTFGGIDDDIGFSGLGQRGNGEKQEKYSVSDQHPHILPETPCHWASIAASFAESVAGEDGNAVLADGMDCAFG